MIFVTGTGRSGTTLFVNALAHAGVNTGPMTEGFSEHLSTIHINRIIMSSRGYYVWEKLEEMVQLVGHQIKKLSNPALKQTELCHTLDVWWAVRKDIKVVVCHRRLDNARRSFVKQSGSIRHDLAATACPHCTREVSTEAWMAFAFGQLMDVIMSNEIPHRFFQFPEDLDALGPCWEGLEPVLGEVIEKDAFISAMNKLTDRNLIHW